MGKRNKVYGESSMSVKVEDHEKNGSVIWRMNQVCHAVV